MHLIVLLSQLLLTTPAPQTINVSMQSSSDQPGNIHLAVYDTEESFEEKNDLITLINESKNGTLTIEVALPQPGRYVLAAYHDVNGNGKLDTNFFGAPAEPYGFNVIPPSKWRAPRFEELAANFSGTSTLAAQIVLKKWKEY